MKRYLAFFAGIVLAAVSVQDASAQYRYRRVGQSRLKPVNFTFDLNPIGATVMPDIDGIRLQNTSTLNIEDIDEEGSRTATLNLGVNFDTPAALLDLTVGIGGLSNRDFDTGYTQAQFAARFKLGSHHVTFGPHFGVMRYTGFEWDDDAVDVKLENAYGTFAGLGFSAGGKACSFHFSVDWMDVNGDLQTSGDWQVLTDSNGDLAAPDTKGEMDLSGVRWQFGLIFRF